MHVPHFHGSPPTHISSSARHLLSLQKLGARGLPRHPHPFHPILHLAFAYFFSGCSETLKSGHPPNPDSTWTHHPDRKRLRQNGVTSIRFLPTTHCTGVVRFHQNYRWKFWSLVGPVRTRTDATLQLIYSTTIPEYKLHRVSLIALGQFDWIVYIQVDVPMPGRVVATHRGPRLGYTKSRTGCTRCKQRRVKVCTVY